MNLYNFHTKPSALINRSLRDACYTLVVNYITRQMDRLDQALRICLFKISFVLRSNLPSAVYSHDKEIGAP